MLEKIKNYNNNKIKIGSVDCNLIWMDIYENEVFIKMKHNYCTFEEGALLAYNLTKHYSIKSYVENNKQYKKIENKSLVCIGCFFIKDLHVSICIGTKTLTLIKNKFTLVDTQIFIDDIEQVMYKKEI